MYQIGTAKMRITRIATANTALAASGGGARRDVIGEADATASGGQDDGRDQRREASRNLIALEAAPQAPRAPRARHSAPFIAQLLANRIGLPQTRQRRRAPAEDGSARYNAAEALSGARRIGICDSRSV
ncbi:MAG TPA: hypothetical protein PK405_07380 [Hyphomicrobiales bacterium]|nr:hypothetical protein [Hyphomicrobiales bacterium]